MANKDEGLPEIDPSEIEFEDKIGEGSYGIVYAGRCRGKEVAIKVFKGNTLDEQELKGFRDEVRTMSKIFHPNVVLFMGACTAPGKDLMIVSDRMPTDLETLLIREQKPISLLQKIRMAKDAALGMNWLHCSNPMFIHRDLKLSNLLVDNNMKVYVCDFGLTQAKPKDVKTLEYDPHGSPLYMAPEVFVGDFNEKCDVYSFGVVLWEMLEQTQAFQELGDDLANFINYVCRRNYRPQIPEGCPTSLANLMQQCWDPDPKKRPSMKEVITCLDQVMVDVAIKGDSAANSFWKKHFLGQEETKWEKFMTAFFRETRFRCRDRDDITMKCLQAVLAEKPTDILGKNFVVTMERFGKVVAWFGTFLSEQDTEKRNEFLGRIHSVLSQRYFFGDISTQEAEEKLHSCRPGTYLVRFSSRAAGNFTISSSSTKEKSKIYHQRVVYSDGVFSFWNRNYGSLSELISAEKKKCGFKHVPKTPSALWTNLFDVKKPVATNVYVNIPDPSSFA